MVMGENSCLRRRGFEFQRHLLDGHFFTLICCKKLYCLFEKTKDKQKRGRGWPNFLKNNFYSGTMSLFICDTNF